MTKGILLFCFDTEHTKYHKILEKCVALIRKNLKLEISKYLKRYSLRDVVNLISQKNKLPKKEIYNLCLKIKK